jgi:hypothetical protein
MQSKSRTRQGNLPAQRADLNLAEVLSEFPTIGYVRFRCHDFDTPAEVCIATTLPRDASSHSRLV